MAQIHMLVETLLSGDNNRMKLAEQELLQIPSTAFDEGIQGFLACIESQNEHVAELAALQLKRLYFDNKENLAICGQDKLIQITRVLQACMTPNKPYMLLKRCCDLLVTTCTLLDQKRELIFIVKGLNNSEEKKNKMVLMYLIQIISRYAADDKILMEFAGEFQNIFASGLEHPLNQVRAASFQTLTAFLLSISDFSLLKQFNGVLEKLLKKAVQLIQFDQKSGLKAIQSLNDLVEAQPKFADPIKHDLLAIYTQVMQAKGLMPDLRIAAMQGVLELCNQFTAAMKKSPYFKTKIAPGYIHMLAQSGIELNDWAAELEDERISKTDLPSATEEHLSQVLEVLGSKYMLPLFMPLIQQALGTPQLLWQRAGLMTLAVLSEGCHQSFKSSLQNIVGLLQPFLTTTDPRLMHAILITMGEFCNEFAPDIHNNFGNVILSFIMRCLQTPLLKLQFKAIQCLQSFVNPLANYPEVKVFQSVMEPMLQQIVKLFELGLNSSNYTLLHAVLEALSSIATTNPFATFYPVFMPGLIKIVSNIQEEDNQRGMIRTKAIETMGYLLVSVRDQPQFMADSNNVIEMMVKISAGLDVDSPLHAAMFILYQNIVEVMKEQFAPYASVIMPRILQAAQRPIDMKHFAEGEVIDPDVKNRYTKLELDFQIDGKKQLYFNTESLIQKKQATTFLSCAAQFMGTAFAPYTEQMLPLIKSMININGSKEIRCNMVELAGFSVANAPVQIKPHITEQVFACLSDELAASIKIKDDSMITHICETLEKLVPYMNQNALNSLPNMLSVVLATTASLRASTEKEYSEKEMDEELTERIEARVEEIEQVLEPIEKMIKLMGSHQSFLTLKMHFPKDYEWEQ